jgi:hypothetical protein
VSRQTAAEAAQPPIPADPQTCRWCRSRREVQAGVWLCPRSCAANDQAPYLGHCEECRRDFHTGSSETHLCHGCSTRGRQRLDREFAAEGTSPRGYLRDQIASGANRRVMEKLRSES